MFIDYYTDHKMLLIDNNYTSKVIIKHIFYKIKPGKQLH